MSAALAAHKSKHHSEPVDMADVVRALAARTISATEHEDVMARFRVFRTAYRSGLTEAQQDRIADTMRSVHLRVVCSHGHQILQADDHTTALRLYRDFSSAYKASGWTAEERKMLSALRIEVAGHIGHLDARGKATARDLQCAVHGLFRSMQVSQGKERADLYRTALMQHLWGVTSTTQLTDTHAQGRHGLAYVRGLKHDPRAFNEALSRATVAAFTAPRPLTEQQLTGEEE